VIYDRIITVIFVLNFILVVLHRESLTFLNEEMRWDGLGPCSGRLYRV